MRRWLGWLALGLACLGPACSESDPDPGADPDDGKYHPPPNGVHITEEEACLRLHEAFQDQASELQCSKTVRICPGFLRVQLTPECMEYDEGSVQGCVTFYQEITACAELIETDCVVTAYPGTEPAGCP